MKTLTYLGGVGLVAAAAFVLFVPTWTGLPKADREIAFPQGVQFFNGSEDAARNQAPKPLPAAAPDGPAATAVYKNVKVLTDVSAAEFMRLQEAITAWVSPKEGCAFCHAGTDWASDEKPQKNAARIMLQMTRHLNAQWGTHLQNAGVTCYTCHRGNPIPPTTWFPDAPPPHPSFLDKRDNWQEAADTVRKFFTDDGFAEYYLADEPIVVQSNTAEPSHTITSWPEAKRIYEMMMQMSDGIGVNCGYCHNSRAFSDWQQSSPYRWIGYDALRLVRDVNRNFLLPLAGVIPLSRQLVTETRLPVLPERMTGAQIGNGLVICATCHLGITKPLNGANMVRDYPGLVGPATLPLPPTTPLPPGHPPTAVTPTQAERDHAVNPG